METLLISLLTAGAFFYLIRRLRGNVTGKDHNGCGGCQ